MLVVEAFGVDEVNDCKVVVGLLQKMPACVVLHYYGELWQWSIVDDQSGIVWADVTFVAIWAFLGTLQNRRRAYDACKGRHLSIRIYGYTFQGSREKKGCFRMMAQVRQATRAERAGDQAFVV